MFNITGIPALDLFVVQSAKNRQKVIAELSNSTDYYIDNILLCNKLTRADFTDSDWAIISQYMED